MSASGRFDIATSKRFVWKPKPVTIDDLATPRNFSLHPAAENRRRDSHRDPASSFLQKHQHKVLHRWKERPRGEHSSGKMDRERGRDRRLVPPFHYHIHFISSPQHSDWEFCASRRVTEHRGDGIFIVHFYWEGDRRTKARRLRGSEDKMPPMVMGQSAAGDGAPPDPPRPPEPPVPSKKPKKSKKKKKAKNKGNQKPADADRATTHATDSFCPNRTLRGSTTHAC
jgi:hypothetical protein